MNYKGTSSVGTLGSLGQTNSTSLRSTNQKAKTTIQTVTASSSQWEDDVIERLRVVIATSTKSLREIFDEFDEDGNGFITQVEFRNAIRRLGLGVTSREIDQVLFRIDTNGDGKVIITLNMFFLKTNSVITIRYFYFRNIKDRTFIKRLNHLHKRNTSFNITIQ